MNYLNESELLALNNLVEQYLVFAEGQAMRRVPMYMSDWIEKLHRSLQLNDRDILNGAGKISHEIAVSNRRLSPQAAAGQTRSGRTRRRKELRK